MSKKLHDGVDWFMDIMDRGSKFLAWIMIPVAFVWIIGRALLVIWG
jgi:hypothetical protein